MLPNLLIALSVGIVLSTLPASAREDASAVHVRIDQPGGASEEVLRSIVHELRRIWDPVGVTITSGRYAEPAPPGRAVVSLRIVPDRFETEGRPVLGWVAPPTQPHDLPTVFVSKSGVQDLLTRTPFRGTLLIQRPRFMIDQLTARAMGRVAAHELGHYLLSGHGDGGLMRANYSAADLLATSVTRFQIRAEDWAAARAEVSRLVEMQTR